MTNDAENCHDFLSNTSAKCNNEHKFQFLEQSVPATVGRQETIFRELVDEGKKVDKSIEKNLLT